MRGLKKKFSVEKLNSYQQDAVLAELGPTLVVAGAGSGKTTVLVKRFEYLVKEKGIDPKKIVAISFSNKSIASIKKKLKKVLDDVLTREDIGKMHVSTLHSFSKDLLRKYSGTEFKVCYDKLSTSIVKQIIEDYGLENKAAWKMTRVLLELKDRKMFTNFNLEKALKVIKNIEIWGCEASLRKRYKDINFVYRKYQDHLKKEKLIDFSDMLILAEKMLQERDDIREECNDDFEAILFDEFQDVDEIQFSIVRLLCQKKRNIFCVGDPDQSIYGFRGALEDSFERFKEYYPDARVFKLEVNYRSSPEILNVANQLISKNYSHKTEFKKSLIPNPTRGNSGQKPVYFITNNKDMEVNFVVDEIVKLQNDGVNLSQIAVISRNRSFYKKIVNKFLETKMPFFESGSFGDHNRMIIKDLRAWLSIAIAPHQDRRRWVSSLERIIKSYAKGVGASKIEELKAWAKENNSDIWEAIKHSPHFPVQEFKKTIQKVGYISKDPSLSLKQKIQGILVCSGFNRKWKYGKDNKIKEDYERARSMLKYALSDDLSLSEVSRNLNAMASPEEGSIHVGTIHGIKGLEFEYVFATNVVHGKLPSKISLNKDIVEQKESALREERRLAYVAFTRPRVQLFITSTVNNFDEDESIFMKDILEKKNLLDVRKFFVNQEDSKSSFDDEIDSWDEDGYFEGKNIESISEDLDTE